MVEKESEIWADAGEAKGVGSFAVQGSRRVGATRSDMESQKSKVLAV